MLGLKALEEISLSYNEIAEADFSFVRARRARRAPPCSLLVAPGAQVTDLCELPALKGIHLIGNPICPDNGLRSRTRVLSHVHGIDEQDLRLAQLNGVRRAAALPAPACPPAR